jgi:hypothetical protein
VNHWPLTVDGTDIQGGVTATLTGTGAFGVPIAPNVAGFQVGTSSSFLSAPTNIWNNLASWTDVFWITQPGTAATQAVLAGTVGFNWWPLDIFDDASCSDPADFFWGWYGASATPCSDDPLAPATPYMLASACVWQGNASYICNQYVYGGSAAGLQSMQLSWDSFDSSPTTNPATFFANWNNGTTFFPFAGAVGAVSYYDVALDAPTLLSLYDCGMGLAPCLPGSPMLVTGGD